MANTSQKIEQALEVLEQLGLPRAQRNERSALTLLALLNLGPDRKWANAEAHMIGITPIMNFAHEKYGKKYAPNTRETVRRQTMHQFVDAGLALYNPDKPDRPVNSPKAVYQIEPNALALLKQYGTSKWEDALKTYLKIRPTLATRYAKERDMKLIPVPDDHGAVLKAITKYADVDYYKVLQRLGYWGTVKVKGVEKQGYQHRSFSIKFVDIVLQLAA